MNMYIHELKSMLKTTVIWVCGMIAIAAFYISMYPSIFHDAKDFQNLMNGYPPAVRAMLGISIEGVASVLGFYSMVITFVVLCGAIQAMNMGVSILSKESRERTADFLLVKPVSRTAIVSEKLLAALTMLLATDVVYFFVSFIFASIFKQANFSGKIFFMLNLTLLFVQFIFFAIGVVVSVFFNKIRTVLPISLGTVFGLYFVGALIATGKNDWARYISPFRYFDNAYIVKNSTYETPYLITGAAIVVVGIIVTYIIYTKKDIHSVS